MALVNYRYELVGLLGDPVDENPTIVTIEAGFEKLGLRYRYVPVRVKAQDLEDAVKGLRAMGFKGSHVTLPHKVEVLKYLDKVSPAAEKMGAVNTIFLDENGLLCGENTDGKGFIVALKEGGVEILGKKAVIIGAGGAARAIAVELAENGASEIVIINRSEQRGRELAQLVNERTSARASFIPLVGKTEIPADCDILVQATSMGLYPDESCPDLDISQLTHTVCCDIIPNPPVTPFVKMCEGAGLRCFTGLEMLVNQAAVSFKLWTGEEAPRECMYEATAKDFNLI